MNVSFRKDSKKVRKIINNKSKSCQEQLSRRNKLAKPPEGD